MLRGIRTFVCDDCGHEFKGMDMEWNATAASAPVRCPQCGSYHTAPTSASGGGILKSIYRMIWKHIDSFK